GGAFRSLHGFPPNGQISSVLREVARNSFAMLDGDRSASRGYRPPNQQPALLRTVIPVLTKIRNNSVNYCGPHATTRMVDVLVESMQLVARGQNRSAARLVAAAQAS